MNKIEIEIPVGKEVDWEASAVQKQIILKDKQLTYKDVCKKLFERPNAYYVDGNGGVHTFSPRQYQPLLKSPINATSQHQLNCILAKNKLANVARYLNGDWKWKLGYHDAFLIMNRSSEESQIDLDILQYSCYPERSNVLFKSKEAAQQAIEILGEETIKLALEPLY